MGSTSVVQNRGIYCGLPTYTQKGLKALVIGSNGISGNHMLRALSENPGRWTEVVSVSRRPATKSIGIGKNVRHVQADLLKDPTDIAKILQDSNVQPDYIFFFAYIQADPAPGPSLWSSADEMCRINGNLFKNCIEALQLAGIKPRRFFLQTGAKNYGVHHGAILAPCVESDPRVMIEPNFYYPQEDILFNYSKTVGVPWNVGRPSMILGAVEDAAMNVVHPLAVYATVQRYKGEKLVWPGDIASWEKEQVQSSAMLNSYMYEYMVLNEDAANQAFNPADGCNFTYARLWTEMAKWYGMEFTFPDPDESSYQERTMPYDPPPRGFGPPSTMRFKFTFVEWAKRPENKKAWGEIEKKFGLKMNPFEDSKVDRIFAFLDYGALIPYQFSYSMTKGRKLGWHGYVDSLEAIRTVIEEFADLRMVPAIDEM